MFKAISAALLLITASASTAFAQPGHPGVSGGDTVIIIEPNAQPPAPVVVAPPVQPMVVAPGAGPGAMPAGQPAPQNENWNNVSHINGTPVPVGTRGDYLYRFRRTNFSVNPVGWTMGFYGASLSYAFHENLAIKGDVSVFSDDGSGFTEISVTAPLYLRRAYQGPFVEPGLMIRDWDDGDSQRGPQVLIGWHWTFDSGFNMAMAVGGGRDFSQDDEYEDYDTDDEPFFNGYFRIGYAF